MDAFDVPGKTAPRQARDEAGDSDVSEVPGDSQPDARRQHWSDEEKAWIVQESFERGTTVEEVAERHGVTSAVSVVSSPPFSPARPARPLPTAHRTSGC